MISTEYTVSEIDEYGDVVDVDHFEEKHVAVAAGRLRDAVAVVVEKVIRRYPAHMFAEHATFKTIETFGSHEALEAGGWLDED